VLAAIRAGEALADLGVGAAVLNLHTLRPLDTVALLTAAESAVAVITVEEHWRSGGLGAAVAETLAEGAPTRIARIGMPDTFAREVGGQEHLLRHYKITDDQIVGTALDLLAVAHTGPRQRAAGSRRR